MTYKLDNETMVPGNVNVRKETSKVGLVFLALTDADGGSHFVLPTQIAEVRSTSNDKDTGGTRSIIALSSGNEILMHGTPEELIAQM